MAAVAACCRCGQMYEIAPDPAMGFAHKHCGLCPKCRTELGDLDKAIDNYRKKVRGLGEDAKGWRQNFNDAVNRSDTAWNSLWGPGGKVAGFFSGLGTVGLAGQALDTPGGEAPWIGADLPDANPDTSFAGMVESILEDNFRPENLSTDPTSFASDSASGKSFVAMGSKSDWYLDRNVKASNAEWLTYNDAIHNRGEIPILPPGKVSAPGCDHATADRNADGELDIFANDSKASSSGNFPDPSNTIETSWRSEIGDAINNFDGDPDLRDELREAFDARRVYPRQANVNYSPSPDGQASIDWVRPGDAESAAAAEAVDTIAKGLALAMALIHFAMQTDSLSDAIGNYYQASKEAEDWQKLLDKMDKEIEDTNHLIECLLCERKNQGGGRNG